MGFAGCGLVEGMVARGAIGLRGSLRRWGERVVRTVVESGILRIREVVRFAIRTVEGML